MIQKVISSDKTASFDLKMYVLSARSRLNASPKKRKDNVPVYQQCRLFGETPHVHLSPSLVFVTQNKVLITQSIVQALA
jgi:hypothetical protein